MRLFLQPFDFDTGQVRLPGQPLLANINHCLAEWTVLIDWLLANNIHVVLGMNLQIGFPVVKDWPDDSRSFWTTTSLQDELVETWRGLASRFAGRAGIVFGLLNEPHGVSPAEIDGDHALPRQLWNAIYPRIVAAVRSVDPDRWILVSPIWGSPKYFPDFNYVTDGKLIYSFHFYAPHYFTHQGVPGWPAAGTQNYPGMLQDNSFDPILSWTKATLADRMQPAVDFASARRARVMVAEFGVTRAAPDAARARWIIDVLDLAESAGFDTCFFMYDGWGPPTTFREGWDFVNSSIEQTMLAHFSRN